MCGRYNLLTNLHEVGTLFGVTRSPDLPKRYNISPTQTVPIVRKAENGKRSIALVRWGLIPVWAKDPKIAFSMINARCETVAKARLPDRIQEAPLSHTGDRIL